MRQRIGVVVLGLLAALAAACGSDAPTVEDGADLEVGTDYRYDFLVHCDMEWLGEFNGGWWRWIDGVDRTFSSMDPNPDDWPMDGGSLQGSLTLVEDDRLTYSIGDEVIAVYAPTDEDPPGCV